MPSTLTPFCSIGGGRHASFQAKNPRAVCCPHCGQQFKPITDCVDLTEDDDEDAPTPTAVPTSRPNERRKLSSTIIPTNRSTSLPAGIENATLDAMARRQESIANTGRKDPIAIGVQATFWVGAGAYEYIGDIKTIEYSSAPKAVRKCMGNVSVVLHRDHGTHEAMVRYLVKQLDLEQSKHAWEVVFSVEKGGSAPGPARLPERAYTTTRLYDLLRQTSTNFDKDIRSSKASLSFWRFFELDPLEMPPKPRTKRGYEIMSDADSETYSPSPKKKKATRPKARLPAVKEEWTVTVKSEAIKQEPTTPLSAIKAAIKQERIVEDKHIEDDDPFLSDVENKTMNELLAEIVVAGDEEIRVETTPSKRQSSRVSKKSWKVQQDT
ncbi:hypothetical protein EDB80DRAFT_739413 [Ilyonectria destructans]|nr:hypothetical protein EDB80DRAFT_739413 [Ilyonectria destructans]